MQAFWPAIKRPVDHMADTAEFHVWGHGTPRTLRVYWALREHQLPFTRHLVRTRTEDMDDPAFQRVSPGRKIPAVEHAGLVLTESAAIADYVFRLAGTQAQDIRVHATIERWSNFVLMEIDATALYVLRRHQDLPQIYGDAPAACAAAAEYYDRQMAVIDAYLSDGRDYVSGAAFSKADIFLASCACWADLYEMPVPSNVRDHFTRMSARPAYELAHDDNFVVDQQSN